MKKFNGKVMRKSFVFIGIVVLCLLGAASCKKKQAPTMEDKLQAIADSAKIQLLQIKCSSPEDTAFYQIGAAPYSDEYLASQITNDQEYKNALAKRDSLVKEYFTSKGKEPEAVYQAASLSKVVFAYIVLKMSDEGSIDLDRPLYEYTDIDRFTDKMEARKITARLVLQHRTGLNDWAASPSSPEWPTSPINFRFPVDSIFNYSGEGFAFLQRAVEKIKGQPINEIAKEYVFEPFDMPLSSYEWMPEYEVVATATFSREGENKGVRQFPRANVAYTLRTCSSDYTNFLQRAVLGGEGLNPSTYAEFIQPGGEVATQFPPAVRDVDKRNAIFWGLGIGIEENDTHGRILWHWGDNGSSKALFVVIPKEQKTFIYFANTSSGHDIINQLTELFLGDTAPLDLSEWITDSPSEN